MKMLLKVGYIQEKYFEKSLEQIGNCLLTGDGLDDCN